MGLGDRRRTDAALVACAWTPVPAGTEGRVSRRSRSRAAAAARTRACRGPSSRPEGTRASPRARPPRRRNPPRRRHRARRARAAPVLLPNVAVHGVARWRAPGSARPRAHEPRARTGRHRARRRPGRPLRCGVHADRTSRPVRGAGRRHRRGRIPNGESATGTPAQGLARARRRGQRRGRRSRRRRPSRRRPGHRPVARHRRRPRSARRRRPRRPPARCRRRPACDGRVRAPRARHAQARPDRRRGAVFRSRWSRIASSRRPMVKPYSPYANDSGGPGPRLDGRSCIVREDSPARCGLTTAAPIHGVRHRSPRLRPARRARPPDGAIAQLGERLDRTQEVAGSSPASSTFEPAACCEVERPTRDRLIPGPRTNCRWNRGRARPTVSLHRHKEQSR